jgi:hypothetical protein
MKQTFSNKYFDWILIAITFLFSIDTVLNLFNKFEYFSSYLLRITFALVSIAALISLVVKNGNGEKYSRFFIIVGLIIPSLLIFNQFITDLIFYGTKRLNFLLNPILYLKFIIGIILFILTIKYSKQTKSDRIKDYGILTSYIGIFLIGLILIKAIEPNFNTELNNVPIWKIIVKTIIGLSIVYLGYRLKNENIKLKTSVILFLISMFIYGLI